MIKVLLNMLFKTGPDWSCLVLRVMLGLVMFPHGAQKLLGWFGGPGFSSMMEIFTKGGMPAVIALLVIIGESLGSLGLMIGFLTRFAAGSFIIIMLGAIFIVHWPHGFFMNWFGTQAGEGFEYHLLMIGMSAALLIAGGGKWSVDGVITKTWFKKTNDAP
jgi:putative oxidoreductase